MTDLAIIIVNWNVRDMLAVCLRAVQVDLTRSSRETQALATEYRVLGVPTVIAFSGGEEIFRITGFEQPAQFLKRLQTVP